MALVATTRTTKEDEPGDTVIEVHIFRPTTGREIMTATYFLCQHGNNETIFTITGGCPVGVELHPVGDRVLLSPIKRTGYTHQLISHE